MIESLGQIMLYVENLDESAKFWKDSVGFEKVEKVYVNEDSYIYELSPKFDSAVKLVLQDKIKVSKMSPELNLGTPSILMETYDIEQLYNQFIDKGVRANPVITMGNMRVFNFADNENNYFAVREMK